MNTRPQADPLFASLDPLVRRGVLNPQQANEIYRSGRQSVGAETSVADQVGWSRSRLLAGLAVLGGTLLLAALSIASWNSKGGVSQSSSGSAADTFVWKPLLIMVGITLLLAGMTVGAQLLLSGRPHHRLATSVLAAFVLLALTGTLASTWDGDVLVYVGSILLLVGGVAGFWYLRGQALVAVAVLGGLVLISQLVSDTLDDFGGGSGTVLSIGMAFWAYGLVVAGAGWRLSCRTLAATLGGAIALASMWLTVVSIGVLLFLNAVGTDGRRGGGSSVPDDTPTDIRIAMVLGLLVACVLVGAYVYTSYSGYLVLAFLGGVSLPGTAVVLTLTEHPLRWAIFFAVLGGLLAVAPLAILRASQPTRLTPPSGVDRGSSQSEGPPGLQSDG